MDGPTGTAFKGFRADNFSKERNLHADSREAPHVIRRRDVLLVHEAMWAVKEAVHELERGCIVVHLLQEILDEVRVIVELVRADTLHILLVIALFLKNEAAKVLCQHEGSIVPRR